MQGYEVVNTEDVMCFTPKDIKEILGCSKSEVYEIFHRADFPSFRVSERKLAVKRNDFYKWQEEKKGEFKNAKECIN